MKDPLGIAGKVIDGKYAVESAVGEGGAGVVYRARNLGWDLPVALKFYVALSSAPEDLRDKLLAEFVQEGRLMSQLSTRTAAIVQPRDMGAYTADDGTWLPYLVLEWLEGSSLDGVLVDETERRIPPRGLDDAMRLLEPVVEALAIAHAENIAHRDIKPENMFVLGTPRTADERLKLLDFGIAKVMQSQHAQFLHTAASATPFTPHYGAPEQFSRGYGATGPWTDVFALALVLLEVMRGGDRAFHGDDYVELATQSRDEEVRPTPRVLGLSVSDDVEAVFARALSVRPQDRYASAGELWSALHGAAHPGAPAWAPASARASNEAASVAPPSASPPIASAPGSASQAHAAAKGGSKTIVAAAAAVAVLVLASAAVVGAKKVMAPRVPAETASSGVAGATSSVGAPASAAPLASGARAEARALCPPSSVVVPGGHFMMGEPSLESARPEHGVFVDAFCMDRDEVTASAYGACVAAGECKAPSLDLVEERAAPESRSDARSKECTFGAVDKKDHPINCVTYDEAARYCAWKAMRLPTEAEWEYAAVGSEGRAFPWGSEEIRGRVNACGSECIAFEKAEKLPLGSQAYDADDGFAATAPVGSFALGSTKTGVQDLEGNVSEWTSDFYAPFGENEEVNPKGPTGGDRRVVRGGSFECADDHLKPAERSALKPDTRSPTIGFRCASALLRR